ncbi:MAG: radical SAM protein [Deltaproteobacteria bacterium]|jgi:hypothetical protein|nr:radical SAM protein [Deltaproteobacteria bacterium]
MTESPVSLNLVHRPPGGQAILYQTENRYLGLLEERFGQKFLDYRKAWAQAALRADPGPFPLSLDLAINSGCDLACLMCPLPSNPIDRSYRPIKAELYANLMAQAKEAGLPALTLGLASEPLLNPQAAHYIALADRAKVMDIRLGTNGQALKPSLINRLLDSGLTRLEISLDAFSPATYAQIRRGGQLAKLETSIEYFLNQRAKQSQELPLLRLSFLTLPQNQAELEPFLARWSGAVDLISIQKPIWFPGSRLPKPEAPKNLPPADQASFCQQPWQRLGLDQTGRVWPCCNWYGRDLLDLSAQTTPITQLWQSPPLKALRQDLAADRLPPQCQACAQAGGF